MSATQRRRWADGCTAPFAALSACTRRSGRLDERDAWDACDAWKAHATFRFARGMIPMPARTLTASHRAACSSQRRLDVYIQSEEGVLTRDLSDDTALVALVAHGDENALGQLYDRFGQAVYSLCLRTVRDGATAEELTQEVFVRLWRSAASFEPERGRVSTWLLRIAHNLALNELRRRQSRPVIATETEWDGAVAALADTQAESDPASVAGQREQAVVVRDALAQLPTAQRQAIELAFFGGLSQAEVAAALGEPLGTVKSRIRLGMQRLRALMVAAGVVGVDEVG